MEIQNGKGMLVSPHSGIHHLPKPKIHRGLIFQLADPSRIPAVAEPWFLAFNADVEFRILMTPEDLRKSGLGDDGKKWLKAA